MKLTVTIPMALVRELDATRKRRGQTRSVAIQEAVRGWLAATPSATPIGDYEVGYRRQPETRRDIDDALASSIALLRDEKW